MALTVHVDIVKRTELAISKDLLVTKIWLILQLKKKEKEKKEKINSTRPKILNTMCEM